MTIKELKEKLAQLPDECEVMIAAYDINCLEVSDVYQDGYNVIIEAE
jgi:hypothetical protein